MPGSAPATCINQQYVPGLFNKYAGDLKRHQLRAWDSPERRATNTQTGDHQ